MSHSAGAEWLIVCLLRSFGTLPPSKFFCKRAVAFYLPLRCTTVALACWVDNR